MFKPLSFFTIVTLTEHDARLLMRWNFRMDSIEIDSGCIILVTDYREQNRFKESVLLLPYFILKNSDGYIWAILEISPYFAFNYILAAKYA